MLEYLKISGVGPAPSMELDPLGHRVNLITGDNGLGKSFLLDIAWWALTRTWAGAEARPDGSWKAQPRIQFAFETRTARTKQNQMSGEFDRRAQEWKRGVGRPGEPGLVIYAQVDGGFAVWDPARNFWRTRAGADPERADAFRFERSAVWDGLGAEDGRVLCNGLLRDWLTWQLEGGDSFAPLAAVLEKLSPPGESPLHAGKPADVWGDARRVPTLIAGNGQEVPIVHASAGARRICALAYLLVWTWKEHERAREHQGLKPARDVVFLIDEIEAHLHPRWQRSILGALRDVVETLMGTHGARVQIIATTHSPLVMASAEPWFDRELDAWFDLDLVSGQGRNRVVLTRREFERQGEASAWLRSEAFNLEESRSREAEAVLAEVSAAVARRDLTRDEARALEEKLAKVLGELDPYWTTWRYLAKRRGWDAVPPAGGSSPRRKPRLVFRERT